MSETSDESGGRTEGHDAAKLVVRTAPPLELVVVYALTSGVLWLLFLIAGVSGLEDRWGEGVQTIHGIELGLGAICLGVTLVGIPAALRRWLDPWLGGHLTAAVGRAPDSRKGPGCLGLGCLNLILVPAVVLSALGLLWGVLSLDGALTDPDFTKDHTPDIVSAGAWIGVTLLVGPLAMWGWAVAWRMRIVGFLGAVVRLEETKARLREGDTGAEEERRDAEREVGAHTDDLTSLDLKQAGAVVERLEARTGWRRYVNLDVVRLSIRSSTRFTIQYSGTPLVA